MKHIILIPPNAQFKKQDFSLQRIAKWLNKNKKIKLTLLHIQPDFFEPDTCMFDHVIEKNNTDEIISQLQEMHDYLIFHRTWMGSYYFAAKLVKEFDNVIINIKDWNFANENVYEFLFPNSKDYEGIEYIFKNCNKILSHFTKEQSKKWAKKYSISKDKFFFFPEYCNKSSFNKKPKLHYKNINLVYAGALPPTSFAEDYFPGKAHLRSIKSLTKQNINIDFVLPEDVFETTIKSADLFKDFLYENETNKRFNLIKGKALDSSILNKYHFGFFELEAIGLNQDLYKYAVTSKFAFYLEAGLPILISSKFVSMAKIIKENKLGIIFSNNDLKNFNNILKISEKEYNTYIKNIEKYRKKFIYNDGILKKLDLFEKKI